MDTSGTVPLEIRRTPAPGSRGVIAAAAGAVAAGVLLAGAGVVAVATQDLDTPEQLNGALVIVVGAMAVVWGARRLRNRRGLLRTDLVLRLDETGVGMMTGSLTDEGGWAALAWADVARVELRVHRLGPPYFREEHDAPVLRFVAVDDSAIQLTGGSPYEAVKAAALGISAAAGALAMILGPTTMDRAGQVRDWLQAHRPEVRLELEA